MRLAIALLIFSMTFIAMALPQRDNARNQTEVNFSDLLIRGKYSLSNEAVVTVEADKVLDALLRHRKDFNERIKRSANR